MIGKLVIVHVAWREMLGENVSASLDRADETFRGGSAPEMTGQFVHDILPGRRRHLAVKPVIGDHLGEVLGEGNIDQHARAAFGCVHVLNEELLNSALMGAGALHRPRHEKIADAFQLEQDSENEKHCKLDHIDVLHRPLGGEDEGDRHGKRNERRP